MELSAVDIRDASKTILDGGNVGIVTGAKLCVINDALLTALSVMTKLLHACGVPCIITSGCDPASTRHLPYHADGYAWDFRSRDLAEPLAVFSAMQSEFSSLDSRWRVLYHDQGFGYHFHVEYQFDKPSTGGHQ